MMRLKIIALACLLPIAVPVQAEPEGPEIPPVPTTYDEIEEFLDWLGEFIPICVKPYEGAYVSLQQTKDATVEFVRGVHTLTQGSENEIIITPLESDGNPDQTVGISISYETAGEKCVLY